jgi:hypothetical protein
MLKSDRKAYDAAVLANAEIAKIIDSLKMGDEAARTLAERLLCESIVPGIWEHFKSAEESQKLYAVFGVVPDVNGKFPPMVVYAALYPPHAGRLVGRVLLHPDDGFLGPIDRSEYTGPRFKLLYPMTFTELNLIFGKAEAKHFPLDRERSIEIIETSFPNLLK